jgi:hypothetical protein
MAAVYKVSLFNSCLPLIVLAVSTGFNFAASSPVRQDPVQTPVPEAAKPGPVDHTVQIFLDADADVMVQNADGRRTGLDFKSRQFVNEIPEARVIARETSTSYVLPFDKSGQPYTVMITGKSTTRVDANLSMTGPGFVVGFHSVPLTLSQVQTMSLASNGLHLSFTANQDGPTPQLFLTAQSGRGKPSYRFEVSSSLLATGKRITVDLDTDKGRLYFKSDDAKKDSFTVKIRRTNPGGIRNLYSNQDISFSSSNSYAMDFGNWDGKSEMCCYEVCAGCKDNNCTKLKNESSAP